MFSKSHYLDLFITIFYADLTNHHLMSLARLKINIHIKRRSDVYNLRSIQLFLCSSSIVSRYFSSHYSCINLDSTYVKLSNLVTPLYLKMVAPLYGGCINLVRSKRFRKLRLHDFSSLHSRTKIHTNVCIFAFDVLILKSKYS